MSMRKARRAILRHEAEQKHFKASKYIRVSWHRQQEKKLGFNLAEAARRVGAGKGRPRQRAARVVMRKIRNVM